MCSHLFPGKEIAGDRKGRPYFNNPFDRGWGGDYNEKQKKRGSCL